MRELKHICESLLDADFDVDLRIGDLYGFEMDSNNPSPSNVGGYIWRGEAFWEDNKLTRWRKQMDNQKVHYTVRKFRSSNILQGLIALILEQPVDFEITQSNIDKLVASINRYAPKLRLDVHLKPQIRGKFMLVVFDEANNGKFMGKIYLIPNK